MYSYIKASGHTPSIYINFICQSHLKKGFPGGTSGKEPACNAGKLRDVGSIPGSGRSPGERHGYPLQYSGLENPMDRSAWRATAHEVAKRQTQLKQLSMHAGTHKA